MFTFTGSVKKSLVLAIVMALAFAPASSFAGDDDTTSTEVTHDTRIISGTRTITNTYNAFGTLMSSTQVSDQVVRTTSKSTTAGKAPVTTESYTVQHSVVTSEWIGGGLKTTLVEGFTLTGGKPENDGNTPPGADNPADDGSYSRTDFKNVYQYDANGRLQGVAGGIEVDEIDPATGVNTGNKILANSITTGSKGTDADGECGGTFTSYSIDTYEIRNGVALKTFTESIQVANGISDTKSSTNGVSVARSTVKYNYVLMGGGWVMDTIEEYSKSNTTNGEGTGSWSEQTKTTKYNREDNGTLVNSTDPETGAIVITAFHSYSHESNGTAGWSDWEANIENYEYTVSYDQQQGYYISWDKTTQKMVSNSDTASQSATSYGSAAAGSGTGSAVNASSDSGSSSDTSKKIQYVYDEDAEERIHAAIEAAQDRAEQARQQIADAIAAAQDRSAESRQEIIDTIAATQTHNIAW
ncbi:MAG: hypothetical protein PHS64_05260 [Candidatus Omnitrophica bacterium]|nr:hypothetical protein [Candidatus Omnitrophota bacterium]MDD5775330.1 hypothetical protein [Candidatus Omnitrophota bacterium]